MSRPLGAQVREDLGRDTLKEANARNISVDLGTWGGLERYMEAIEEYATACRYRGEFPRSWEEFRSDLALWIAYDGG